MKLNLTQTPDVTKESTTIQVDMDVDTRTQLTEDREPPKPRVYRPYLDVNHRYYPTLDSMYVMMNWLGLAKHDDSLFLLMHMKRWDEWLVEWIEHPLINDSSEAMCILLQQMFNALRLPLSPTATARTDAKTRMIQR